MTAKQNYEKFMYTDQTMLEANREQCEQKMIALQGCKISISFGWMIFWTIFGGFLLGFIISFGIGISNSSSRSNYKNAELMRLQSKINQFLNYELPQQSVPQQPVIKTEK